MANYTFSLYSLRVLPTHSLLNREWILLYTYSSDIFFSGWHFPQSVVVDKLIGCLFANVAKISFFY